MTKDLLTSRWASILSTEKTLGSNATMGMSFRPTQEDHSSTSLPLLPPMHIRESDSDKPEEFEVIASLGRGGMGEVLRARQRPLRREVAIKKSLSETKQKQFLSEALVTGFLDHTNIVPVHSLSEGPNGQLYMAMKLIRGAHWRGLIREGKLDLRQHIKILDSVCQAASFAHQRGIIHRDIKPENVMVGEFGQVFLVDWGLATSKDPALAANMLIQIDNSQSPVGTPTYMSPELALGDNARQDARTDVYLLGACLHEVLTGQSRHQGDSLLQVLESALASAPFVYSKDVPEELAAICHKAMSCEPANRYESAEDFRRALDQFWEHQQAIILIQKGSAQLNALEVFINARPAPHSPEGAEIHRLFASACFALEHALEVWSDAREGREALQKVRALMLEYALQGEDLPLAARLAREISDEASAARVEALRQRLAAKERELAELREAARRLDLSTIIAPLGWMFLLGALLGLANAVFTGYAWRQPDPASWFPWVAAAWLLYIIIIGVSALFAFRRKSASVLSAQIIVTWGSVAVAIFLNMLISEELGISRISGAAWASLFLGVGFASMAIQTKRWLFALSLLYFVGGVLVPLSGSYGIEVFGTLWALGLGSVGAYLLRAPGSQTSS
jgi:predicted Ser/Thr protein kinase